MSETADRFISDHVNSHFTPNNETRYHHEPRNPIYKNRIKVKKGEGQGKYVDNILTGRTRRQVLATIKKTVTQFKCVVRATVPAYFAKPFKGTVTRDKADKRGVVRQVTTTITRQPDKMRELQEIDRRTVDDLTRFAVRLGRRLWAAGRSVVLKKVA
jgi:hypothetical protein